MPPYKTKGNPSGSSDLPAPISNAGAHASSVDTASATPAGMGAFDLDEVYTSSTRSVKRSGEN